MKTTLTLPYTCGSIKLTAEQAALLFTPEDIQRGEKRGEITSRGPWQIPVSYQALATSQTFDDSTFPTTRGPLVVYGVRTLTSVQQSGYNLEGRISVNGKRVRGFTSSQLFELPDGKLINCAIIHACLNQPK